MKLAQIVDENTRIIDVDFGTVGVAMSRAKDSDTPNSVTFSLNGQNEILSSIPVGQYGAGSYIQYKRLDLSFMTMNNEMMMPVNVNSQRTSPVPLGSATSGATFNQVEEFIYIFTRPLNNELLLAPTITTYRTMRNLGLDGCDTLGTDLTDDSGLPNQAQCIYAEKRTYQSNMTLLASQNNGQILNGSTAFNTLEGEMSLASVITWGSMGAITGPNLHCYRVIIDNGQSMPADPEILPLGFVGLTDRTWPPVNVSFLCKDPNFSEGEYITRLANAMSSNAEGGPVA